MGARVEHRRSPVEGRTRIPVLPTTRLGWWAVGLAAAFFPLVFAAGVIPRAVALGFFCGLAGGAAALLAIIRERERALLVLAAVVPLVVAGAFVLAEMIGGEV